MAFVKNVPPLPRFFSFAVWSNCMRGTRTSLYVLFLDAMTISLPPLSAWVSHAHWCMLSLRYTPMASSQTPLIFLRPTPSPEVSVKAVRIFIRVLSVLMHDVHSTRTPLSDIPYADDNVLVARAQLTLHRLLHTLQHEACKRGLLLSPDKCQLLQLHTDLPTHLSPAVDPHHPCPCQHRTGAAALGAPLCVLKFHWRKYCARRVRNH